MSGVELMHDSAGGMGRCMCRQRVSASTSGGETSAASHSRDSLDWEEKKRDKVSGQSLAA